MSLTPQPDQNAVERYLKAHPFVSEQTARQIIVEAGPFCEMSLSLASLVPFGRVPTHRQVHCVLSLVSDLLAFDLRRIAIERDCDTGESLLVQPIVMIWQADSTSLRLGHFYNIPTVPLQGFLHLESEEVAVNANALLTDFFNAYSSQEEPPLLSVYDEWLSDDLPLRHNQTGRVATLAAYRNRGFIEPGAPTSIDELILHQDSMVQRSLIQAVSTSLDESVHAIRQVLLDDLKIRRAAFVSELDRFKTDAAFERHYGTEAKALDLQNIVLYLAENDLCSDVDLQRDFLLHLVRDDRAILSGRNLGAFGIDPAIAEDANGDSLECATLPDKISVLKAFYHDKLKTLSRHGEGGMLTEGRYKTSLLCVQYCLRVLDLHGEWFRNEVEGR